MKKIYFLVALAALFMPSLCQAQFSMQNGDHTFEIAGDIMAGYNYRLFQPGETDFHKNNFVLDEARFRFLGRIGNKLQYKLELDAADLITDIQAPTATIGFLKDAYVMYKTKYVNIKAGYNKVPFSLNSLIDEIDDPFLARPLISTKINSRRDMGVTLTHSFPLLHINVYGGVYSGMGENVFSTDNTSGKPEYVGRIEYAYPSKYQQEIIDWRGSPVPVIQVGGAMRYEQNTTTVNDGDFNLTTVDGKKTAGEVDATLFYKGFSLQFEAQRLKLTPMGKDTTRLLSEGSKYTYLMAGGFFTELNYYCKPLKSILCVRYDELNPSDLQYGNTERTVSFAYNYCIKQNFLCIKLQYQHHLPTPYQSIIWHDDELTAELQVIFN